MNPITPQQLLDAQNWRYATKTFDATRKIPADHWSALEASLVLSASSFGLQPYRFLVVQDAATREKLLPHSWNQRQVVDASHFVVFASRTGVTEAEIDQFVALTATARGTKPEALAGYRGMMTGMLLADSFKSFAPQWAARQAYLALGNLLTSAALLGIDACPMEGFSAGEYDKILNLPAQGLGTVVACALGYRHTSDKYATLPKVRFPKTDLIKVV